MAAQSNASTGLTNIRLYFGLGPHQCTNVGKVTLLDQGKLLASSLSWDYL